MAGVSLILPETGLVETGPTFCIVGLTIPPSAPIARLVLETEPTIGWKTPSLTTHPNAKCIGYTTEGWAFAANTTEGASLTVDELDTPIRKSPSTSSPTASGKLVSLRQPDMLETLFGLEQLHTGPDAFERYADQVASLADISVAWIWRKPKESDPSDYVYRYLWFYKANQTAKFVGNLKRGELFAVDCTFEALNHLGRTYEIYIEEES